MIVRFFEWDQPKNINSNNLKEIDNGDDLVVEHVWGGSFLAKVLLFDQSIEEEEAVGTVLRKATEEDFAQASSKKEEEEKIMLEIKKKIREAELPMKIFETRLSLDGKCLVVAFIAEGRVDFRSVVRDISGKYQKTVRFQQIGSRDEARHIGGFGICGKEFCCRKFNGCLKSITTEMARCQMVSHRGTERISGACGRLMCCLGFESEQYQELLKELPQKGDKIKVKGGIGRVLDLNPISQEIKVEMEDGSIVSAKKEEIK